MANVYAWPPVGLTGWELHTSNPVSRSPTFFQGTARTSSFQRERRYATAVVTGIGSDKNGAGYVENLKRLILGGRHLVRVPSMSPIWALARGNDDFTNAVLEWTDGGTDMLWTSGGTDMVWTSGDYAIQGTATTDDGWPAVALTGLPANKVVARPSEYITVTDSSATEASRVLTAATSDGSGNATVRLFDAFTIDGLVSIGGCESIVFEALDMPRAVQPVGAKWSYTWNFREVFEDEYDSWTELDPWA